MEDNYRINLPQKEIERIILLECKDFDKRIEDTEKEIRIIKKALKRIGCVLY